jgi:hypothetical protein
MAEEKNEKKVIKSVSLNLYEDGAIELSSKVDNKLELLGLLDLLTAKKNDIIDAVIESNSLKHIKLTTSVAVALSSLMKALEKPTEG